MNTISRICSCRKTNQQLPENKSASAGNKICSCRKTASSADYLQTVADNLQTLQINCKLCRKTATGCRKTANVANGLLPRKKKLQPSGLLPRNKNCSHLGGCRVKELHPIILVVPGHLAWQPSCLGGCAYIWQTCSKPTPKPEITKKQLQKIAVDFCRKLQF